MGGVSIMGTGAMESITVGIIVMREDAVSSISWRFEKKTKQNKNKTKKQ